MDTLRVGGIEAGGTKFICAIGTPSGELISETTIPTGAPEETMRQVIEFFRSAQESLKVAGIGIGSFGPVQLNPALPRYGYITSTPKQAWRDFDILGTVRDALGVPVALVTDVNAAALAESNWGAARDLPTFLYVTVGTGIGGGAMVEGRLLNGMTHPEMGHIRIPHDRSRDPFPGGCPYHGDCLEGLASAPALESRWGVSPVMLAPDHPAWVLEAEYLALGCVNWICTLSPERIVMGGGVMREHLFPLLRERVAALMNGYLDAPQLAAGIDQYIVPAALGNRAGVLGALALASVNLAHK
jgi:fructokinase